MRAEVDIKEGMLFEEFLSKAAAAVNLSAPSPSDVEMCMVFPDASRIRVHELDVIEPGRPLEVSLRDGGVPTVSGSRQRVCSILWISQCTDSTVS